MKTFSVSKASLLTGTPERRIVFYIETGVIKLANPNPKRGYSRELSAQNVFEISIIETMSKAGIKLETIKAHLDELANNSPIGYFDLAFYGSNDRRVSMIIKSGEVKDFISSDDGKLTIATNGDADIQIFNLHTIAANLLKNM